MPTILGPGLVLGDTIEGYSVTPQTYTTYTWVVTGGEITYGDGMAAIIVHWSSIGIGTVQAEAVTPEGNTDQIFISVDIEAGGGRP